MKNKILILAIATMFFYSNTYSQGCGDAGACSIGVMKVSDQDSTNIKNKNFFKIGTTFGLAQYDVKIVSPYMEYTRILSGHFKASVKLSSSAHYGDLTTTYGLSDLYLTGAYSFLSNFTFVAGIKLPLNKADMSLDGLDLPMSYQSTLGTTDLITGLTYRKKAFSFSLAYQQPISQNNNGFYLEDYPVNTIDTNYLSTNGYYRQSDVLLRLSHTLNFKNKKMTLISSILPIYHLGKDTYINKLNEEVEIDESQGLTLNLNLFYQYKLTDKSRIELSVGAPIRTRTARPDGLTAISIGLEFLQMF